MKTVREIFLADIETYLRRSGMTAYHFGRTVLNDNSFVQRLRTERQNVQSKTMDKVYAYIADNPVSKKKTANQRSVAA